MSWLIALVALVLAGAASAWALKLRREESARRAARVAALASAIDRTDADTEAWSASSLFAAEEAPPRRSRFAPALALGALVIIATIAGATMLAGGARSAGKPAASAAAGTGALPLELVSMTDRNENGTVTISGFVRNPQENAPLERLTAVVFFFDGQGGFLASARALADFPRLAPGDETPFVVTAPAPRGASRFRVSFRAGDGGLVPHVDRRGGR